LLAFFSDAFWLAVYAMLWKLPILKSEDVCGNLDTELIGLAQGF